MMESLGGAHSINNNFSCAYAGCFLLTIPSGSGSLKIDKIDMVSNVDLSKAE
jgi:hypothetical protein